MTINSRECVYVPLRVHSEEPEHIDLAISAVPLKFQIVKLQLLGRAIPEKKHPFLRQRMLKGGLNWHMYSCFAKESYNSRPKNHFSLEPLICG